MVLYFPGDGVGGRSGDEVRRGGRMFQLTRKTDYAIIALSHMTRQNGCVCTAREIADRFHVPQALLMNVLKIVSQAGLLQSHRGAKGGYTLARPAGEISLADIIAAVEGPIRFVQCAEHEAACDLTHTCPVRTPMQSIHRRMEAMLRQTSLADIVHELEESERSVFVSVNGAVQRTESPCTAGVAGQA